MSRSQFATTYAAAFPMESVLSAAWFQSHVFIVARISALSVRRSSAFLAVLAITAPADANGVMLVGVRMLAEAPSDLLCAGSKFELYEGRRCVAQGEVVQA